MVKAGRQKDGQTFCKEPMRFWAGSTVPKERITDVKAYNHANGILWIAFSLSRWAAGLSGIWSMKLAVRIMTIADSAGIAVVFVGLLADPQKVQKESKKRMNR